MIYFFANNKTFLVDSWCYEDRFFAFVNGQKGITSIEYHEGNHPHTTVCEWKNEKDFIKGITWYDWILAGVKNKALLKKIRNIEYNSKRKRKRR